MEDVVGDPPLRDPLVLREQVYNQLRCIIDPDLHRDIVSLGFIKKLKIDYDKEHVAFDLELTTPACPVKDVFVSEAESRLKELEWVSTVDVTLTAREQRSYPPGVEEAAMANLKRVGRIIAVASCKGGVGKSTIASILAHRLRQRGAQVGLCDCDVYGPSLPYLVDVENPQVLFHQSKEDAAKLGYDELPTAEERRAAIEKQISGATGGTSGLTPVVSSDGVKLMSYGFLKAAVSYAAIRGPMASNVIYQLVTQTLWGDLDYLVLDLPPGTSDIHLTLSQSIPITGAVMVTTSHILSISDVEKGIKMFAKVGIPTVGLVENMAVYACPHCHHLSEPFKSGGNGIQRLKDEFGIALLVKIPLNSEFGKKGQSLFSDKELNSALDKLTDGVVREVSKGLYREELTPNLRCLGNGMMELCIAGTVLLAPARNVRLNCKCAVCVDEYTGETKINQRTVPIDVRPVKMKLAGNYAVHVDWSDNHSSLFSFESLEKYFQHTTGSSGGCWDTSQSLDW